LSDSAEMYGLLQGAVQRVCALAPEAARMNKQTLRALASGQPDIEALCREAYAYAPGAEHREGIESFLAKRKAAFSQLPSNHTSKP
jgi:1,4-dihydroxy-2-naphthoyl-CoA synthase